MLIADQLRKKNRAEYLLYMWQVEDLLRSFDCNAERVAAEYLPQFKADEATTQKMTGWYADLCEMMVSEGVRLQGHLQINRNVLQELEELHGRLLKGGKFPYYREMYYRILPYIVELRAKGRSPEESELQTCFEALYGVLMLRLKRMEITPETDKAMKEISGLLGQLSDYYSKDAAGELEC